MTEKPDRNEAADYYFIYIEQVEAGDIVEILRRQSGEALGVLESISEEQSRHRYAAGKWSIREVLGHLTDTERLFVVRAMWFARGFDTPLPSFDQHVAVKSAESDERSWRSLVDEFRALRASTVAFFESLPADAWMRRGIASDNPFSVRALAYIASGHVTHHLKILQTRYLQP